MRHPITLVLIIPFFIGSGGRAQTSPASPIKGDQPASIEMALRRLVDRYYAAYDKQDWVEADKLWSPESPSIANVKRDRWRLFTQYHHAVKKVTAYKIKVTGERASLRVALDLEVTDRKTNRSQPELWIRKLELIKEAETWKIWRNFPAARELATALVEAKSNQERSAMLDADRDLVTWELVEELHLKGKTLYDGRNYESANQTYELSKKIAEEIDNRPLLAAALNNLAYVNFYGLLKRGAALIYYEKSLRIYEELGDRQQMAIIQNMIGEINAYLGQYEQSIKAFSRSVDLWETLKDTLRVGRTLHNLGNAYYLNEKFAMAEEHYKKALRLSQGLPIDKLSDKARWENQNLAIFLYNNLGAVAEARGSNHHDQALAYFRKALDEAKKANILDQIMRSQFNIGNILARRGDPEAMEWVEKVLQSPQRTGGTDTLWRAWTLKGKALMNQLRFSEAHEALTRAIDIVEDLRRQESGDPIDLMRFLESRLAPYGFMTELHLAQNAQAAAFNVAERAKARVLSDVLRNGGLDIVQYLNDAHKEEGQQLARKISDLNLRIFQLKQSGPQEQPDLKDLDRQLEEATNKHKTFLTNIYESIYESHPELRLQRGPLSALTLEEAGALLPDTRTALLEFVVADTKSFLFVLTRSAAGKSRPVDFKVFTIAAGKEELEDETIRFKLQVMHPQGTVKFYARGLYDLLFKSAREVIGGKDKLIIAPDGPLWELPFQALMSSRNRYLIQDHALSYVPSLTILRELIKLSQQKRQSSAIPSLFAIGNPALDTQSAGRVASWEFEPLPDADNQVRRLGEHYDPKRSRISVGIEATEELVKTEAGKHEVVHLAAHGWLNNQNPMYSYLVLAQALKKGFEEDGFLVAWEIAGLKLKADLVVLSACETARGQIGSGEGLIGLTWALFAAGVPTSVASQWKVRSDSTTELMVEFHRQLRTRNHRPAQSKAEALRRAALKLLRPQHGKYRHPFHWAGFVVMGNGF